MSSLERNIKPYSKAIVKLLKGSIERTSNVWEDVVNYQTEIQDYISQIGLELIVKKEEGFAFVKQFEDSEGNTLGLVARRQIGFETSIVLSIPLNSLFIITLPDKSVTFKLKASADSAVIETKLLAGFG